MNVRRPLQEQLVVTNVSGVCAKVGVSRDVSFQVVESSLPNAAFMSSSEGIMLFQVIPEA